MRLQSFFHGMKDPVDNETDLVGSCALLSDFCPSFMNHDGDAYVLQNYVLPSITLTNERQVSAQYYLKTQKDGTESVEPILGEAFKEALRITREQFSFAATPPEGECSWLKFSQPWPGNCVQSIQTSSLYLRHLSPDSNFKGKRRIGIGLKPGSTKVLDRKTGRLVECNEESCPHAVYHEDIGKWVNSPITHSFPLFGAVSRYAGNLEKNVTTQFLNFITNKQNSLDYTIPIANTTVNRSNVTYPMRGIFPFRYSHFNLSIWLSKGYDEESAKEYLHFMNKSLTSKHQSPLEGLTSYSCGQKAVSEKIYNFLYSSQSMTELQIEYNVEQLTADLQSLMTTKMNQCTIALELLDIKVSPKEIYIALSNRNAKL